MLIPGLAFDEAGQRSIGLLLEVLYVKYELLLPLHLLIEFEVALVALPEQPLELAANRKYP
jgi:hypothetical protein